MIKISLERAPSERPLIRPLARGPKFKLKPIQFSLHSRLAPLKLNMDTLSGEPFISLILVALIAVISNLTLNNHQKTTCLSAPSEMRYRPPFVEASSSSANQSGGEPQVAGQPELATHTSQGADFAGQDQDVDGSIVTITREVQESLVKYLLDQYNNWNASRIDENTRYLPTRDGDLIESHDEDHPLPAGVGGVTSVSDMLAGNKSLAAPLADTLAGQLAAASIPQPPRPFHGDLFYSFQLSYYPIHVVVCLILCTVGIFANVTNIVVLTRPNMITAVNTILTAMAFFDLLVNIVSIPYLVHELIFLDPNPNYYSYTWSIYNLFQAHVTVTAHTISIWLTCVLSTWRYFVVCRSQSNQRNWSVGLAKRTIIAVFIIVPVFCLPNYLSFSIVEIQDQKSKQTMYKLKFSDLANRVELLRIFHFWIFSCITKLVPCVLLTYFTTALIRKLLSARERRLRLCAYGSGQKQAVDQEAGKLPANGTNAVQNPQLVNASRRKSATIVDQRGAQRGELLAAGDEPTKEPSGSKELSTELGSQRRPCNSLDTPRTANNKSGSSCATEAEMLATSCNSSSSDHQEPNQKQQSMVFSRLIVAADGNTTTTTSSALAINSRPGQLGGGEPQPSQQHQLAPPMEESPRSASTCGALETYTGGAQASTEPLYSSQELGRQVNRKSSDQQQQQQQQAKPRDRRSLTSSLGNALNLTGTRGSIVNQMLSEGNIRSSSPDKRASQTIFNNQGTAASRGRSMGSTTLAPFQMIKLQATQRQLSQNETTTRLLIAVMIVFLICETPAGILAALCAIYGQDFYINVYHPTGILTDFLALLNSAVNFILYCFMSTQFRITFYRVVLRCPAPNAAQPTQTLVMTTPHPLFGNHNLNQNNNNHLQANHANDQFQEEKIIEDRSRNVDTVGTKEQISAESSDIVKTRGYEPIRYRPTRDQEKDNLVMSNSNGTETSVSGGCCGEVRIKPA